MGYRPLVFLYLLALMGKKKTPVVYDPPLSEPIFETVMSISQTVFVILNSGYD